MFPSFRVSGRSPETFRAGLFRAANRLKDFQKCLGVDNDPQSKLVGGLIAV